MELFVILFHSIADIAAPGTGREGSQQSRTKALVLQPRPETVAVQPAQGRRLERTGKETSTRETLCLEAGEVIRTGEGSREVGAGGVSNQGLGHLGLDVVCTGSWPGFCLSGFQLMG